MIQENAFSRNFKSVYSEAYSTKKKYSDAKGLMPADDISKLQGMLWDKKREIKFIPPNSNPTSDGKWVIEDMNKGDYKKNNKRFDTGQEMLAYAKLEYGLNYPNDFISNDNRAEPDA